MLKFFGILSWSLYPFFFNLNDWEFPEVHWIKVNTDGAGKGCSGVAACGGTFRGSKGISSFSAFLGL